MGEFACHEAIRADRLIVPDPNADNGCEHGLDRHGATGAGTERALPRRIVATTLDLVISIAPAAILGLLLVERFPLLVDDTGRRVLSDDDQQRIDDIGAGFNRAVELGDTLYALDGRGWWLTTALLAAMTVAVFVVVPAALGGRSPGKLLAGVRTAASDQADPGLGIVGVDEHGVAQLVATEPEPERAADGLARTDERPERADRARTEPDQPAHVGDRVHPGDPSDPGDSPPTVTDDRVTTGERAVGDAPSPATESTAAPQGADGPGRPARADRTPAQANLADEAEYLAWDLDERSTPSAAEKRAQVGATAATSFERLALPESSLSESPLAATTLVRDERTTGAPAPAQTPVWSERWQAWLYEDVGTGRLFRHDTELDRWVPLGRDVSE